MLSALCPMRMTSRLSYILLGRSSGVRPLSSLVHRPSSLLSLLPSVILLLFLASCGGGKGNSTPANVGGGYTLQVSGGTLNDGSGSNGLVVLATLRDSEGLGPAFPWTISITGPDIPSDSPIIVEYQDSYPNSYMSWEWAGFEPSSGTTYRATATSPDGSVSIRYDFSINNTKTLTRPDTSVSSFGSSYTLTWLAVSGAASYSYEIFPPSGGVTIYYVTNTSANLGTLTSNGDYLVRVRAYASNRASLQGLPAQENVSEYIFTFPVGGNQTSDNYSFIAKGGLLDYGLRGPGNTPIYGLSIWTSILQTSPASPPAGNWNITIKQGSTIIANFIYPAGSEHYAYWYYSIEPVIGTSYTVEATYGTAVKTATFTIADSTPTLNLPFNINAIPEANNDVTVTWNTVTGAGSYLLNIWAEEWNNVTKQWEYNEVFGQWVDASTTNVRVPAAEFVSGTIYDVYITAHEVNMSSASAPSTTPSEADMSENYNPVSFVAP